MKNIIHVTCILLTLLSACGVQTTASDEGDAGTCNCQWDPNNLPIPQLPKIQVVKREFIDFDWVRNWNDANVQPRADFIALPSVDGSLIDIVFYAKQYNTEIDPLDPSSIEGEMSMEELGYDFHLEKSDGGCGSYQIIPYDIDLSEYSDTLPPELIGQGHLIDPPYLYLSPSFNRFCTIVITWIEEKQLEYVL